MYEPGKTGIELIADERADQTFKGFTPQLDSAYTNGQLISAADAHMEAAEVGFKAALELWPWDESLFHVNTPISSLAKAGALIAAEIDRRIAAGETY